jgi:hypothetical protein
MVLYFIYNINLIFVFEKEDGFGGLHEATFSRRQQQEGEWYV